MSTSKLVAVDDNRLGLGPEFTGILVWVFAAKGVVLELRVTDDVHLVGNGGSRGWLVTGHHDNFDASPLALEDGDIDQVARRIVQRNDSTESQAPHGEPSINARVSDFHILPRLPALSAELVGRALLEVLRVEMKPSKSEHTFSVLGKLVVGHLVALAHLAVQGLSDAVDEHVAAPVDDTVGRALQEDGDVVLGIDRVFLLRVGVTDQAVELDVTCERDLSKLLILAALNNREG